MRGPLLSPWRRFPWGRFPWRRLWRKFRIRPPVFFFRGQALGFSRLSCFFFTFLVFRSRRAIRCFVFAFVAAGFSPAKFRITPPQKSTERLFQIFERLLRAKN